MSKQTINIGASPNDGTGTPLRTSFDYCNQNFTELYTATGPSGNNIVVPGSATITGDLTVNTNVLKVDSTNDRVGIGNATPSFTLDVNGAGSSMCARISSGSGTGLRFDTTRNVSGLNRNYLIGPDILNEGWFSIIPSTALGGGTFTNSIYNASSDGIHTWSNGAGSELMRLNSTGLGIGASPTTKLDVLGSGDGELRLRAGSDAALIFSETTANKNWKIKPSSGTLCFQYSATAFNSGYANLMVVTETGNVGVGLTPRAKLDVNGGLLVNNYITSTNYAPLSVTTASTITTPSTFTNAINIWNPTTVGAYSNITFGYNILGLTNAPAYIGFVSTSSASGGFGDLVFGTRSVGTDTAATERVRIDASGNLLVGKASAGATTVGFQAESAGSVVSTLAASTSATNTFICYSTGAAAYRFYVGLNGTINATNTAISAISDARFKENVQDIDVGLGAILALKPRKFDWKAGKGKDIKGDRGFIAQEFESVFPNLVDEWKDPAPEGEAPYKSVRQDLIPVLVKAIQELTARVQTLEAR